MNSIVPHKRVLLRADAGPEVGHGHLMRLVALAELLSPYFACYLVAHQLPDRLVSQLPPALAGVIQLDRFAQVHEEAAYVATHLLQPHDIWVMDGYQFTSQYQQIIRKAGAKVVCLDDLCEQYFYADAVINPAGGISSAQYRTEIYTQLALGPAYALLRKPFRELSLPERRLPELTAVDALLICLGGADRTNLTQKVADALLSAGVFRKIHLVVGASYQHMPSLTAWVAAHPETLQLHEQLSAEEMVTLMQQCQIAVAPASTIAYELCHVGIGLVTGTSADNQQHIARFLSQQGCALSLGNLHDATPQQFRDTVLEMGLSQIHQQVARQRAVFGQGSAPLVKLFQRLASEQEVRCRRAQQEDLMTYFAWANDPEARRQAVHPELIRLEEHSVWYLRKLRSTEDYLYIFEQQEPIGQVRFDAYEHGYVVSYSVDPQHRGRGLGTVLIKLGLEALQQELGQRPFVMAYVKPTNPASLKVFQQNSFIHKGLRTIQQVTLELFEK